MKNNYNETNIFDSDKEGLEKVLDAVDALVKHDSPIRQRPEELLKVSYDTLPVIFL